MGIKVNLHQMEKHNQMHKDSDTAAEANSPVVVKTKEDEVSKTTKRKREDEVSETTKRPKRENPKRENPWYTEEEIDAYCKSKALHYCDRCQEFRVWCIPNCDC